MEKKAFIGVKRFTTEQILTGIRSNNSEILDWIQDTYVPVIEQYLKDLKWRMDDVKNVFSRTIDKIKHQIQFKKIAVNKSFKEVFRGAMNKAWLDTISSYTAKALVEGNSKIIIQFTEATKGIVLSLMQKRSSKHSVQEVYQKAFWRILENIGRDKYEEKGAFKTYFLAIVNNILLEEIRDRKKHPPRDDDDIKDDDIDIADDYDFYDEHEERLDRLDELLNKANERCKQIFDLYYWKSYKIQEIADQLNISLDNAKKRLSRCRQKLRDNF